MNPIMLQEIKKKRSQEIKKKCQKQKPKKTYLIMSVVTYAKTNYSGENGYVKETREPSK